MNYKTKINTVAVMGGVHGDETVGIHLARQWMQNPKPVQRETFSTLIIHANKEATKLNRRFVDQDLNRSFLRDDLAKKPKNYEQKRAQEIDALLGPKGAPHTAVDFLIDIHTTTAQMGVSIIIDNSDPLSMIIAEYCARESVDVHIYEQINTHVDDEPYVTTVVPRGFVIEVGSLPKGVLHAHAIQQVEHVVQRALDALEMCNMSEISYGEKEITIYTYVSSIDFPRNTAGDITACIHPDREGKDYHCIQKGDPLFLTFEGEKLCFEEEGRYYPVFINEVAYYESGVAMELTQKKKIRITALGV